MKSRYVQLSKEVFVALAEALQPDERFTISGALVLLTADEAKFLIFAAPGDEVIFTAPVFKKLTEVE